jgi:hypothetical protein
LHERALEVRKRKIGFVDSSERGDPDLFDEKLEILGLGPIKRVSHFLVS